MIKAIETEYNGYLYSGDAPRPARKKLSARANLAGQRIGRLIVVEDLGVAKDGWRLWGCVCDCGTKKAVRSRELLRGHTQSCGCLQRENQQTYGGVAGKNKLSKGLAAANALFSNYRKSARQRGYQWALTKEAFYKLTAMPCHYCAQEPSKVSYGNSARNCNGEYTYNGIDRVDNERGYVDGNVVSCCYICNVAKASMSQSDFLLWIERVYQHSIAARSARFEYGQTPVIK